MDVHRPGPRAARAALPAAWRERPFPNRYRVEKGRRASRLFCSEAPTIAIHLQRGLTFTANEARNAPEGAIFLDGAAQGAPFLCPERGVYNLDHHEGCVRSFTYATCEQAMVLVRKRLDLRRRDWTVYANDADLDTVLALWVILNHLRLVHETPEIGAEIMPLLRLEGAIDALGTELADLCALPPDLLESTRAHMDRLRERELALKRSGHWERVDLAEYVAGRLLEIDRLVYEPQMLEGHGRVEEIARAEIAPGSIGVVCRSEMGVYEVERELRRLHGDRLGLFALQKNRRTYTLRRVDPSLPASLDVLYAHLNLVDPGSGGSVSADRWGGSDEIGGSPRRAGTRMSPGQILEACRRVHRRAGWGVRLARLGTAALAAAALLAAPALARGALALAGAGVEAPEPLLSTGALVVLAGLALLGMGRRAPGVYGLRVPGGRDWWLASPFVLFAAAAGGLWLPVDLTGPSAAGVPVWALLLCAALLPLGVELVFRGVVHGVLAQAFAIQQCRGRWFLSVPVLVSAAFCTLASGLAVGASLPPLGALSPWLPGLAGAEAALVPAATFVLSLGLGIARERSESIAAPLLLHWAGLAAVLAASPL